MEYRQLGQSDVKVSAITLGTWAIGGWMWGGTDEAEAIAAIQASLDAGVTSIDTAPVYGYGVSEEIVGKAVAGRPRDSYELLTKYCLRWDDTEGEFHFEWTDNSGETKKIYKNARPESIIFECEQCLRRLGTDYLDLFQCHWRDNTTPVEVTAEAVATLIEQGKVRAAGVSNFTVEEMVAYNSTAPLASNQPPYSMVMRDIEVDVLPYCRENGIGTIAYSSLQRGLLTGKFTADHKFSGDDHRAQSPLFQGENLAKVNAFLDTIRPIADGHNATLAQLVIAWTIRQPGITAALVGARNPKQALENAHAGELQLTAEELSAIDVELAQLELDV
jgi:aryl-alcohol dehydrogenase-like predicted oxidoreductase